MRTLRLSAILVFLACLPSWGAITAYTVQWYVTTGGSDSNSGGFDPGVSSPGTNYALQNSAQISYTDIVLGTGGTTYTSVLNAVTSAIPGNTLVITSGTGCTTGTYEILSQTTGTATVNASMGTAASTCHGTLGGAKATICSAYSGTNPPLCTAGAMSQIATALNTVWIKSGTYTVTNLCTDHSSTNCVFTNSNSSGTVVSVTLEGYNSTPGDITSPCSVATTCPLITTTTTSVIMFDFFAASVPGTLVNGVTMQNLEISNSASSNAYLMIGGYSGGPDLLLNNVKIDVLGTNSGGAFGLYNNEAISYITCYLCEFNVASGNYGINDVEQFNSNDGHALIVDYSYFHGAGTGIWDSNDASNVGHNNWHIHHSTFSGMSRGIYAQYTGDESVCLLDLEGNNFYNMTNEAVRSNGFALHHVRNVNNIYWGGTYGIYILGYIANGSSVPFGTAISQGNAYGNQSTAAYVPFSFGAVSAGVLGGTPAGMWSSDVILTASPFTNPSANNFALNNTSGGGAALKAAGFPGVSAFGTGYQDIGALQHQASSSGGAAPHAIVQ